MSSADFLQLAIDNSGFLLFSSFILCMILYFVTFPVCGGVSDPFHLYYAFTVGTSYAVVSLLFVTGNVGLPEIGIVGGFGLLFLIGYRGFSRYSIPSVPRLVRLYGGGSTFFVVAIIIYFLAAAIYVKTAGLPFLSMSRFETNRGFGVLPRIMDPLRLFIIAHFAVETSKRTDRPRPLVICAAGGFAVISSLLDGAKIALLECAYAAAVAVAISARLKAIPVRKLLWPACIVLLTTTGYALIQLYFNLSADAGRGIGGLRLFDRANLLAEMFAARLVANGDAFYLGLPPEVLHSIHIDHPLEQLLGPILGSGVASPVFGYDINNNDVGRQIILYWDPYFPVAGGPTSHFDLTAYVYWGPVLGVPFVVVLALILAQINRLKQYEYSAVGCAIVAVLYCRSLPILLNPAIGIAFITDIIILFTFVSLLSERINRVARGHVAKASVMDEM